MTRRHRLVRRIVRRVADASFEDVCQVFVIYDWTHARSRGCYGL